jgi:hypothetical protein
MDETERFRGEPLYMSYSKEFAGIKKRGRQRFRRAFRPVVTTGNMTPVPFPVAVAEPTPTPTTSSGGYNFLGDFLV